MKDNNKGLTIVELVIALALMGIIAGIGVRNIGVLKNYRARECKEKIVSAIQNTKINCLSKSSTNIGDLSSADTYMEILCEDGKVYVVYHTPNPNDASNPIEKKEQVSVGSGTKISYSVDGTSGRTYVADKMKIAFNRSTGAFLPTASGNYYTDIYIENGTYERHIELATKTGKVVEAYSETN